MGAWDPGSLWFLFLSAPGQVRIDDLVRVTLRRGRVKACRAVAASHSASVAATSTASATVLAVISAITPATSAVRPSTLARLV